MNAAFRRSSWIVTPCLAAIAAAYLALIWMPSRRVIKEWREQVETKRQFVAQATGLADALAVSQHELDKAQAVANWGDKSLVHKRSVTALYGKINALAQDAGLAVSRFDPQPFVVHEKLQEIPIAILSSGTFAQVFEFLRALEQLPTTIWVESLRIEKSGQNTKDVRCELNLVVFSDNQQGSDYAKHSD